MSLVLMTLMGSVAMVAIVALIAFVDVAFHAPAYSPGASRPNRSRPLAEGELSQWCSATARRMAQAWFEAYAGAENGMTPGRRATKASSEGCALENCVFPCGSRMTGVTMPELRQIVKYLRHTQPTNRVNEICRQATENSRQAAGTHSGRSAQLRTRCPLACDDGSCLAYPVQPIQCRVRCALFDHEIGRTVDADCAYRIVRGAEQGLSNAVAEASSNLEVYELNSALATALSLSEQATHPSSLWDANAFENCLRYKAALAP